MNMKEVHGKLEQLSEKMEKLRDLAALLSRTAYEEIDDYEAARNTLILSDTLAELAALRDSELTEIIKGILSTEEQK